MNTQAQSPTETILIRYMKPEDLEQVQAIDKASFALPWPASAYHYELYQNPDSLLWVAEVQSEMKPPEVIGLIVVWLILDEAHIATIAVRQDYRGKGVARHLLVTALRESIQKGSKTATLEVRANNRIAQNLYHRFGFKIVGHRPHYYYDNNEDAIIMTVDNLDDRYIEWLDKEKYLTGEDKPGVKANTGEAK